MTAKPRLALAVLVVEDDPQQMELMRMALEDLPVQVDLLSAEDGSEALHLIEGDPAGFAERVAMVVLDLRLPRVHGLQVLQAAQTLGLASRLPFIVLTTADSAVERDRALKSGASDYLVKPLGYPALQALVMGLYERWLVPRQAPA